MYWQSYGFWGRFVYHAKCLRWLCYGCCIFTRVVGSVESSKVQYVLRLYIMHNVAIYIWLWLCSVHLKVLLLAFIEIQSLKNLAWMQLCVFQRCRYRCHYFMLECGDVFIWAHICIWRNPTANICMQHEWWLNLLMQN